MQIILNLDESLLNEACQRTNFASQEDLVNLALQELVRSHRKKNRLDLVGQIQFTEDFDHKYLRETRHAADWHLGKWRQIKTKLGMSWAAIVKKQDSSTTQDKWYWFNPHKKSWQHGSNQVPISRIND